jgi:hypothetical protein
MNLDVGPLAGADLTIAEQTQGDLFDGRLLEKKTRSSTFRPKRSSMRRSIENDEQ